MKVSHILTTIIIIAFLLLPGKMGLAFAQSQKLIDFKIEDQFKKKYTEKDILGSVIVAFVFDRDGRKLYEPWKEAVHKALQNVEGADKLRFIDIAHMKGVPFFLKGMIRGKLPKEKDKWMLLDWKGKFYKEYDFEKKSCNIAIFDSKGVLIYWTHGKEVEQVKVNSIVEKLKGLIDS